MVLFNSSLLKSQSDLFAAYDQFGNVFSFDNLSINSPRPFNSTTGTISAAPTVTCQSGYFILHFSNDPFYNSVTIRNIVCQVFSDFSNFIVAPSTITNNPIHIFVGITTQAAGLAGSIYICPNMTIPGTQGFIRNQIEKALISGLNPYNNLPAAFVNGTALYSGYLDINPFVNWNTNLTSLSINSNELDLYSVVVHEVAHFLGFMSLLSNSGFSTLGQNNNYFTHYDKFLHTSNGQPLLASQSGTSCGGQTNVNYTPTTTTILGASVPSLATPFSCSTSIKYIGSINTATVYTPSVFSAGSSFNHFEDKCLNTAITTCTPNPISGYDKLYFVMTSGAQTGSCYVKRFLQEEEKNVLCDLGYSITPSNTYSSTAVLDGTLTSHVYPGSACSPTALVYGQNDGLNNNVYTFTTTGTSITESVSTILSNDIGTSTLSCVELIYNNASLSYTPGSAVITVTATAATGLVILRYFPVNSAGQFGNPTYIYFYFSPIGCPAPDPCNLVMNGGFETQAISTSICGSANTSSNSVSCWDNYFFPATLPSAYLYVANCPNSQFSLGSSNTNYSFPLSSYNGTVNNTKALFFRFDKNVSNISAFKNQIASPLIPGQVYDFSFWVLNSVGSGTNANNQGLNPNNFPVVISIASNSVTQFSTSGSFPVNVNTLDSYTIPATSTWQKINGTFTVPSNLPLQNSFIIGIDFAKTFSLSVFTNDYLDCFIDDISISPASSVTFSIPNATGCGATSFTDLAQYATPINGTFTGVGVTTISVGGGVQYDFNSSYTLAPGNYPITFSYINSAGCTGSLTQNIIIAPAAPLTLSRITGCNGSVPIETITVSSPGNTVTPFYYWMPGYLIGATQTLNPGTYTVTGQFGSCLSSNTIVINAFSSCCNTTIPTFTESSITSSAFIGGPLRVMNSFTIQAGADLQFMTADLLMEPNIKITIAENATLGINSSVIHTCGNYMWKGIELFKGGTLYIYNTISGESFVEDAETAIEVKANSTSTTNTEIYIKNTIFNKNLNGISISNFTSTSMPFTFELSNCAFTCRDFPPTTSISTTQLMAPSLSTLGIASPYFDNSLYNLTTLKFPYTSVSPQIAIKLNSVGVTTNNVYHGIQIGDATNASNFNLFDSHQTFVYAVNSNVTLRNNVFQNQINTNLNVPVKMYSGIASAGGISVPSSAIIHSSTNNMLNSLNLDATNVSTGNRFWNCYRAIDGFDTYAFSIAHALFRSTQSSANTSYSPGNSGITLATNRFQYDVADCEFTNIANCINIPIAAGYYPPASTSTSSSSNPVPGILASRIIIYRNNFSAGTVANAYINQAITISNPNLFPWLTQGECYYSNGNYNHDANNCSNITIARNNLSHVYRGIDVNGVIGFYTDIATNTITLAHDNVFTQTQKAINFVDFKGTNNKWGQSFIAENQLSGVGSVSVTNNLASLMFLEHNIGIASPSIVCNDLRDSYNGFVFSNNNTPTTTIPGARWFGNNMENLHIGMLLTHTAIIGQQGATANGGIGMGNAWNGSWPGSGASYGIFTSSSTAAQSPLVVSSPSSTVYPPNLWGNPAAISYLGGASISTLSSGYNFSCHEPTQITEPHPVGVDYENADQLYMAQLNLYNFLYYNDSIMTYQGEYVDFFDDLEGSSIDVFRQVEQKIYSNNTADARDLLSGVSPTNNIEQNYLDFYNLFAIVIDKREAEESIPEDEGNALLALAQLCPAESGSCIHQARALYNSIYKQIINYNNCNESYGREGLNQELTSKNIKEKESLWDLDLFPNPAQNELNLVSDKANETINVCIADITGRLILNQNLELKNKIAKLKLELLNGAYLITIKNTSNETITKKLLIAK